MNVSLRCGLPLLLLCVLGSQAGISKESVESALRAVDRSLLIEPPPPECKKYLKQFLQWQVNITGNKNITWIVDLVASPTCQKCFNDEGEPFVDMEACMECHQPFLPHLQHTTGCAHCLDAFKGDTKSCYKCFLNTKLKAMAMMCYLETETQNKIDWLELYFKGRL